MQGMSEFMQKSGNLVKGEQGRFACSGFGEVHYNGYQRTYVQAVDFVLSPELCHPGSSAFAFPGEKVGIENSQKLTVSVVYFKSSDIFVVFRNIIDFSESYAI